jgi:serine/threonine protein phosphatase 1
MERIFAIGDIHGCLDKLVSLMETVDVDLSRDTLVFMGDYIDRGPHSREVVDYLLDLKARSDKVIFLKGNHEEMLEDYVNGTNSLMFVANGGEATILSYRKSGGQQEEMIPEAHMAFFQNLQNFYETKDYFFVHAGLRPGVAIKDQVAWDMLWIRDQFIYTEYDFGKRIIFAHTPFREPLVMENKIGIDTGAVYGNKLTCVELPALRFTSV